MKNVATRRRHQGRASCEIADHRFETVGPAPIYKLVTLVWLHGHRGECYEVWDDVSPFGKPGGLALHGRVSKSPQGIPPPMRSEQSNSAQASILSSRSLAVRAGVARKR